MADFLTTKKIASEIEEIIKRSRQKLYIITPYLSLSSSFSERLFEATKRGVDVYFVYGKTELSKYDQEKLDSLDLNVYYKENLYTKCYINEDKALIASMNLHSYSEANNREFGVMLDKVSDNIAYQDCIEEVDSIIISSEIKKQIIQEDVPPENFKEG